MAEVRAPVLQEYVLPPEAVIVAMSPAQIRAEVVTGVMPGEIFTVVMAVSLQPFALVTTTE